MNKTQFGLIIFVIITDKKNTQKKRKKKPRKKIKVNNEQVYSVHLTMPFTIRGTANRKQKKKKKTRKKKGRKTKNGSHVETFNKKTVNLILEQ